MASITYNKIFGDYTLDAGGAISNWRGVQALLDDRDYVAFTFKVTF
jgi:hypothetical protein